MKAMYKNLFRLMIVAGGLSLAGCPAGDSEQPGALPAEQSAPAEQINEDNAEQEAQRVLEDLENL